MSLSYDSLLRKLYQRNIKGGVRMGLENSQRLYEALGKPLDDIPVIHVGGTNGKGSVCFKTSKILELSGLKTGLFVSPHVSCFRERIQVNSEILPENEFKRLVPELLGVCDSLALDCSFFELATALAFMKFKKSNCDVVVLEVGCGGELDATNVITNPLLSIITSVQLDHMKILGHDVDTIARVKAGIMKPFRPVLVGPNAPLNILQDEAINRKSLFFTINDFCSAEEIATIEDAEHLNQQLVKTAVKIMTNSSIVGTWSNLFQCISETSIINGCNSRPPCRFEVFPLHFQPNATSFGAPWTIKKRSFDTATIDSSSGNIDVILDIGHNVEAIRDLVCKMKKNFPNRSCRVVVGMSSDKSTRQCISLLLELVESASHIYCVSANHTRSSSAQQLWNLVKEEATSCDKYTSTCFDEMLSSVGNEEHACNNIRQGFQLAAESALTSSSQSLASNQLPPVVLVVGTFFIMGEVRSLLGIDEPRDPIL